MPFYEVIYEGTVREIYSVEADSEEEARKKWSDNEPVQSEVIEGDVVDIREEEEV